MSGNFIAMNSISLDEVLRDMQRKDRKGLPIAFAMTVVTCDINRKTGGERLSFKATLATPGGGKKAYHSKNDIRNLKLTHSEEIRAIHPILITKYNGRTVYI